MHTLYSWHKIYNYRYIMPPTCHWIMPYWKRDNWCWYLISFSFKRVLRLSCHWIFGSSDFAVPNWVKFFYLKHNEILKFHCIDMKIGSWTKSLVQISNTKSKIVYYVMTLRHLAHYNIYGNYKFQVWISHTIMPLRKGENLATRVNEGWAFHFWCQFIDRDE